MVANAQDGVEKCSNISLFEFRIGRLAAGTRSQTDEHPNFPKRVH